ncbi:MAG: hypothetical protein ABIQ62_08580 [Thermomonas sp.]
MVARTQLQAVLQVPRHVEPKPCFVTHVNNLFGWDSLAGTGCAHWVAHQKNLRRGHPGDGHTCVLGHPTRVRDVVLGRAVIPDSMVQRGDIWATEDHCGVVETVMRVPMAPVAIMIRNCSSKQGGVYLNDWKSHFKGAGKFYR